ncbi:hypothetical protein [Paenibacillus lemnae]|nr:hypothetical protein [Paenibacillus lemnae]
MQDRGQDFMAFALDGGVCSFVLCDGVGLSFRGDMASKFLGRGLLSWLRSQGELNRQNLERKLVELSAEASQESDALTFDEDTPLLLKEVLQQKQQQGSEAMYICGRIELPGRFHRKGKLWLAWQGDSRLRMFQQHMELTSQFGDRFHTSERWSTRSGPIGGRPHIFESRLDALSGYRLLMYSDGLNDLDPILERVPDEQVQLLMDAVHTGGLEDDASFLEISW